MRQGLPLNCPLSASKRALGAIPKNAHLPWRRLWRSLTYGKRSLLPRSACQTRQPGHRGSRGQQRHRMLLWGACHVVQFLPRPHHVRLHTQLIRSTHGTRCRQWRTRHQFPLQQAPAGHDSGSCRVCSSLRPMCASLTQQMHKQQLGLCMQQEVTTPLQAASAAGSQQGCHKLGVHPQM